MKIHIALMVVSFIKHTEQNNAFFCCSAFEIHIKVVIAIVLCDGRIKALECLNHIPLTC